MTRVVSLLRPPYLVAISVLVVDPIVLEATENYASNTDSSQSRPTWQYHGEFISCSPHHDQWLLPTPLLALFMENSSRVVALVTVLMLVTGYKVDIVSKF